MKFRMFYEERMASNKIDLFIIYQGQKIDIGYLQKHKCLGYQLWSDDFDLTIEGINVISDIQEDIDLIINMFNDLYPARRPWKKTIKSSIAGNIRGELDA